MRTALIGHSGFIGGSLLRQREFDCCFNSRNIEAIAGERFDRIVCVGAPGRKWYANAHPGEDSRSIGRLYRSLAAVRHAGEIVLISTVDARSPRDAYGGNRAALEEAVRPLGWVCIIRLPAVFGAGLRKNALFDLIHGGNTAAIAENAVFQWYNVDRLAADIDLAVDLGLRLVHFLSEPVGIREIRDRFFPGAMLGAPRQSAPDYRVAFDDARFFRQKEAVLAEMAAFIESERGRGNGG